MSDPDREPFTCHRCGTCCTSLRGAWEDGQAPASSTVGGRIHRLATPGGLRVFAWEAHRFPRERLEPLLVVADGDRERLVALAYELAERVCPNYDDEVGCTIYEDRPLVCRAYPLLVVQGDRGPEVAVSGTCPGRVAVAEAADEDERPERVLARAYPAEFAPALAVPATVRALDEIVGFLDDADVISPVEGLDEPALSRWSDRQTIDLVALVEEAGVLDRERLAERARMIVATIRERFESA